MASLKLMFLVTLLLIALVGRSSAVKCRTNRDCPLCDIGETYCVVGRCTCLEADVDVAHKNKKCKTDGDCANLDHCFPDCNTLCKSGICTCDCS